MNSLFVVFFCAVVVCSVVCLDPEDPKAKECMAKYNVTPDDLKAMSEGGKPADGIFCAAGCTAKGMDATEVSYEKLNEDQKAELKKCLGELEATEDDCESGKAILTCVGKAMSV